MSVMKPPEFSQQNIELPGGIETLPGEPLMADSAWMKAYLRTLGWLFSDVDPSTVSVVDIGCLEGAMAVEFARAGFDAAGLEVRPTNLVKCRYVADSLKLPNLRFIEDDARNIANHGPFDVSFCSGLLYHLDRPAEFLAEVAKVTNRALILETHYATKRRSPNWALYRPWYFSRMTTHEGNQGRWWKEFSKQASQDQIEATLWSSWGNAKSFWIEKHHLIQTLRNVGFSSVYEQFDLVDNNVTDHSIEKRNRSLFVAVK
jgi:SAM-dependent methyltransferase